MEERYIAKAERFSLVTLRVTCCCFCLLVAFIVAVNVINALEMMGMVSESLLDKLRWSESMSNESILLISVILLAFFIIRIVDYFKMIRLLKCVSIDIGANDVSGIALEWTAGRNARPKKTVPFTMRASNITRVAVGNATFSRRQVFSTVILESDGETVELPALDHADEVRKRLEQLMVNARRADQSDAFSESK